MSAATNCELCEEPLVDGHDQHHCHPAHLRHFARLSPAELAASLIWDG